MSCRIRGESEINANMSELLTNSHTIQQKQQKTFLFFFKNCFKFARDGKIWKLKEEKNNWICILSWKVLLVEILGSTYFSMSVNPI